MSGFTTVRESIELRLIGWIALLGPLGNLVPLPGVPSALRFFYLLLLPAIAVFLWKGISLRTFNLLLLLFPMVLYMSLSSVNALIAGFGDSDNGQEGNPIVRFGLFLVLLVFTICAIEPVRNATVQQKLRVAMLFMKGYLISLMAGYMLFVGFYAGVFSAAFLEHFEVLVQFSFGLLRFSPGSYPNEYGIVSSFALSVLTLLIAYRRQLFISRATLRASDLSKWRLGTWYLLTLGALFLATTRAAYVSYLASIVYISLAQGSAVRASKLLMKMAIVGLLLFACVQPFFDVWGILEGGFHAFFDQDSLANGRIDAWNDAAYFFRSHELFGTGFGSMDMIHNVYLQMFFGLGVLGFSLLIATLALVYFRAFGFGFMSAALTDARPEQTTIPFSREFLLEKITGLAVLHVVWFATSNHSLNHFLTWFTVLLVGMNWPRRHATSVSTEQHGFSLS